MLIMILAAAVIILDIIPMMKKKQLKEAVVLGALGAITLAYGYYYNTHRYTASLVSLMFELFNAR